MSEEGEYCDLDCGGKLTLAGGCDNESCVQYVPEPMSEEKKGAARLDTSSRDAMHWAECLSEAMGESLDPTDTGWLVGWFANYWAAVHDPMHNTIQSLQQEVERLREALRPFSHPDLCARLSGNVQGNDSIIFGRNKAKITLGDCRKAAALLSTEGGE